MFEKKVDFRGHLIRPKKINNYTKFSHFNYNEALKYLNRLTEAERNMSIAIVVERQLETIASGINLIPQLNKKIEENEIIEMESSLKVALDSCDGQLHMILPLFYSFNLKTNESDYLIDEKIRDICFNFYLNYLKKQNTNLEKVRKDYLDFQYHEYCTYPISKEFEIVKNTLDLDNIHNKPNIFEIIFGLLAGLFFGGCFGPLGWFMINSRSEYEDETNFDRIRPSGKLGVIIMNVFYLSFLIYAVIE